MLEGGRHYKKLSPFVAYHQKILDDFLDQFWEYYRSHAVRGQKLLAYRDSPCEEKAHIRTQCAVELRSDLAKKLVTWSWMSENN